jgi:threonine dehydrogenase-like Zn-dependent dehydrogenase
VNTLIGLIQVKDLTVYGTMGSSDIWPDALKFVQRHGVRFDDVITATYPLDRADEADRSPIVGPPGSRDQVVDADFS